VEEGFDIVFEGTRRQSAAVLVWENTAPATWVPQGPPFFKVANLEVLLNKGESSKQVRFGEG
jgi:hypothetical protein